MEGRIRSIIRFLKRKPLHLHHYAAFINATSRKYVSYWSDEQNNVWMCSNRWGWGAVPTSGRDWEQDFTHENGNYHNHCIRCGCHFRGHKRRMICRLCAL